MEQKSRDSCSIDVQEFHLRCRKTWNYSGIAAAFCILFQFKVPGGSLWDLIRFRPWFTVLYYILYKICFNCKPTVYCSFKLIFGCLFCVPNSCFKLFLYQTFSILKQFPLQAYAVFKPSLFQAYTSEKGPNYSRPSLSVFKSLTPTRYSIQVYSLLRASYLF
jgi:hypothetical protein